MLTGLLIKNIKCLIQTEEVPKLKICGSNMSEIQSITMTLICYIERWIDNADFGKMDELD
jgi:hypothetical protein